MKFLKRTRSILLGAAETNVLSIRNRAIFGGNE